MARIANPDYCQIISPTPIWLPAHNNSDKRESEAAMFLNYFALGVLIFVFLVIFYGIIAIHDIPYLIAKNATILMPTPFIPQGGSAYLRSTLSGRSCGSGPRFTNRSAAGGCSRILHRKRKRLTQKLPRFLIASPGWSSNSLLRKT